MDDKQPAADVPRLQSRAEVCGRESDLYLESCHNALILFYPFPTAEVETFVDFCRLPKMYKRELWDHFVASAQFVANVRSCMQVRFCSAVGCSITGSREAS